MSQWQRNPVPELKTKFQSMAAKKLNYLPMLGTEWCGITPEGEKKPKSFDFFENDFSSISYAYRGLFFLIGDYRNSKNIKFLDDFVSTGKSSLRFQELILLNAIHRIEAELIKASKIKYERIINYGHQVKGKIKFDTTAIRNLGIDGKFVTEQNKISFNHPLDYLIKEVSHLVLQKIGPFINQTSKADLLKSVSNIHGLLDLKDDKIKVEDVAVRLIYTSEFDFDLNFKTILADIKILAHYYFQDKIDISGANSNAFTQCFLLNLNRPFEALLKKSLVLAGLEPSTEGFNKIYLPQQNNVIPFRMKPDCYGTIHGKHLILDAKHKIFQETAQLDEDEEPSIVAINRNDFYQIISYAKTHSFKSKDGYYGLVGLNNESSFSNQLLGPKISDTIIDSSPSESILRIKRISVNFGSLLCRIGKLVGTDSKKIDELLIQLGYEVIASLE